MSFPFFHDSLPILLLQNLSASIHNVQTNPRLHPRILGGTRRLLQSHQHPQHTQYLPDPDNPTRQHRHRRFNRQDILLRPRRHPGGRRDLSERRQRDTPNHALRRRIYRFPSHPRSQLDAVKATWASRRSQEARLPVRSAPAREFSPSAGAIL